MIRSWEISVLIYLLNIQKRKNPYSLYAYATDEHNIRDWQKVRVLVDRPLELGVSLSMPYTFRTSDGDLQEYADIFQKGNAYLVSQEDPSFLKVVFPETSFAPPSLYSQEIRLIYTNKNGTGTENFDYKVSEGLQISQNQGCFSFPGGSSKSKDCTLSGYKDDISSWSKLFMGAFNNFREVTEKGELNLSFSSQYCARFEEVESEAIKVVVNECAPHRNQEHPWAYPQHNLKYENFNFNTLQGDYIGEEEINPFEATHSCCIGVAENPNDWQIAGDDYPKP